MRDVGGHARIETTTTHRTAPESAASMKPLDSTARNDSLLFRAAGHHLRSTAVTDTSSPKSAPHRPQTRSRRRREPDSCLLRIPQQQAPRRQDWAAQTPQEILGRYRAGKVPPLCVLEVMLSLFNALHTSMEKTVSHKTRQERAQFLRRFFRDLHEKAGFKQVPDPRNLGQKHLRAMVRVWQDEHLKPATIQTYLSFLRGLAMWTGKHGFVREPAYYGLDVAEYQRHEYAQRDRSWSAQNVDIDALVDRVMAHDRYVGASLRLVRTFGLRRKESVLFRPYQSVVSFADTGMPPEEQTADQYARIHGKGGRVRFVPIDSPARRTAITFAQEVASSRDAHLGDPAHDLKRNLRRFDNVLRKFGIAAAQLGITAHGLRHEALINHYESLTGRPPPVRGGNTPQPEIDLAARQAVARLAGHSRSRSASAYLGQPVVARARAELSDDDPSGLRAVMPT
jgi:site-specific recombinase XerC